MSTLKEIAIELLEKYEASETDCIYEYSGDIYSAKKELDKEIAEYRKEIEQTEKEIEQTESDRIDNEIEYAWKTYCDTDEQTEMDKCYKCKWWNYSYGCSNKKGICDFEQADTPQTEGESR